MLQRFTLRLMSWSCCCGVSCCVMSCCVVLVLCCVTVWHAENFSVSTQKRTPCVHSQCARGAGTHRDALNVHTEGGVLSGHTEGRGRVRSSPVLLTTNGPRRLITCPRGSPKVSCWILPNLSLRIGREQHFPDFSNHSLYLIKLFNSSSPEGHCGGNQL